MTARPWSHSDFVQRRSTRLAPVPPWSLSSVIATPSCSASGSERSMTTTLGSVLSPPSTAAASSASCSKASFSASDPTM